jgi:hypothetical protein
MPTLSKEQIIETELTLIDLLDQLEELTQENVALKQQLQQLMADRTLAV